MNKLLAGLMVAGSASALFATDARIATMGGTDHFFRDPHSIYRNPANIGMYDRILIGSYGIYSEELAPESDTTRQSNKDASRPYFGAVMSLGGTEENPSKFIFGATFNRHDSLLNYLDPNHKDFFRSSQDYKGLERAQLSKKPFLDTDELAGKVDLFAGYTLQNGMTVALSNYFAFQSEKGNSAKDSTLTSLVKTSVGVSGPVSENADLEAVISLGLMSMRGTYTPTDGAEDDGILNIAENDIAFSTDVRSFIDMPLINGDFVPHIQANFITFDKDESIVDFNAGLGVNSNIDRGFFWTGVEFFYKNNSKALLPHLMDSTHVDLSEADNFSKVNSYGGKVAMGIERNIGFDWLVWRVGGAKVLEYETREDGDKGSRFLTNPEGDVVSFGLGIDIEERINVDAVIAESNLYTLGNIISGDSHHINSRISATFKF